MVGIVAGLLATTVLTATAGSEGGILGLTSAPQAAPPQQDVEGSAEASVTSDEVQDPRAWVWHGVVVETDIEGGHLVLRSRQCGTWVLMPANDAVAAELEAQVGAETPVFVVGHVSTEPNIMQRPTIEVVQVAADRSELPDDVRLFPRCEQKPASHLQRQQNLRPALAPNFINILQRLGLHDLHEVPTDEGFEHFLSAEVSYLDAEDSLKTALLTAGVVIGVGDTTLTYDPNGPETSATVTITDDTKIIRHGERDLSLIEAGDKVFVLQVNGETVAVIAAVQVMVWPGGLSGTANADGAAAARPQLRGQELRQGAFRPSNRRFVRPSQAQRLTDGAFDLRQLCQLGTRFAGVSVDREEIQSFIETFQDDLRAFFDSESEVS
jgi:hypothetical protein